MEYSIESYEEDSDINEQTQIIQFLINNCRNETDEKIFNYCYENNLFSSSKNIQLIIKGLLISIFCCDNII